MLEGRGSNPPLSFPLFKSHFGLFKKARPGPARPLARGPSILAQPGPARPARWRPLLKSHFSVSQPIRSTATQFQSALDRTFWLQDPLATKVPSLLPVSSSPSPLAKHKRSSSIDTPPPLSGFRTNSPYRFVSLFICLLFLIDAIGWLGLKLEVAWSSWLSFK